MKTHLVWVAVVLITVALGIATNIITVQRAQRATNDWQARAERCEQGDLPEPSGGLSAATWIYLDKPMELREETWYHFAFVTSETSERVFLDTKSVGKVGALGTWKIGLTDAQIIRAYNGEITEAVLPPHGLSK